MTVRDIQRALAERGYTTGPIDGIWGRQTIRAVKSFQHDNHLEVDGVVGPQTRAALLGAAAPSSSLLEDAAVVWFQEARRLLGVRETPGKKSNQVILDWADGLGIDYAADDVPWCGLFVAHCIGATLTEESLPANPLGARSWLRFGVACTPTVGAVLVFWRERKEGWKGHVGFYAGEDGDAYRVLGGNQSDGVSLAWIAKDRLLDARWPATVAVRTTGPVNATRTQELSTDES